MKSKTKITVSTMANTKAKAIPVACVLNIVLCALAIVTAASCKLADLAPDDHFFVETEGAVLPVWVMRNSDSNAFIIHTHGGMGTSYYKTYYEAYQRLRTDYNIVFFSQRGVESSQGNPPLNSFNWNQFTRDLELVRKAVATIYAPESIFILGYSWSGYLVKRYLTDTSMQQEISGYIDLCGMGYDMNRHYGLIQTKVLAETSDQKILSWIAMHPEADLENYLTLVEMTDELTPQQVWDDWDEQMARTALHYGAASPVNIFSWMINSSRAMRFSEKWNVMNRAMFDEPLDVSVITIPTLIVSGAYDYDCNDLVGADLYEAIGTPAASKEHYVFPNSGHFPDLCEPELFAQTVSAFIERHR